MKKSTVGETVLFFIFIFKGRRADFLIGNIKKKIVKIMLAFIIYAFSIRVNYVESVFML